MWLLANKGLSEFVLERMSESAVCTMICHLIVHHKKTSMAQRGPISELANRIAPACLKLLRVTSMAMSNAVCVR